MRKRGRRRRIRGSLGSSRRRMPIKTRTGRVWVARKAKGASNSARKRSAAKTVAIAAVTAKTKAATIAATLTMTRAT
jgi:hypothetical protein